MSTSGGSKLRIGLPKGSLQETTQKLFAKAGFDVRMSSRSYYPDIDDDEIECILMRPQEMARYVAQGVIDCGITGLDWVLETGADVEELADLRAPWPNYGPVRWVLAVKEGSPFEKVEDLAGKRIAADTELIFGETDEHNPFVPVEQMMPFVPFVRVRDVDEAIAKAKYYEHNFRHTSIIHSNNVRNMTAMGRALDTTLFVKNGPCMAALGLGGEGYLSYSIATPTGEGVTTPLTFTRERRCSLIDDLRILGR